MRPAENMNGAAADNIDVGTPAAYAYSRLFSHLAVVVKLDKFVNKVAGSQGIGEFIDHYSYAAANSSARSRTSR